MDSGAQVAGGRKTPAVVCLFGAVLCFGSVPLFLKYFTSYLDAWTVNGVRYGVAALVWVPFALFHTRKHMHTRGVWRAALIPAAVNLLGQILWAFTPYYNDAAVVGFGIRLSFLFALCFGLLWLPRERHLARLPAFWLGVAVSVVGVVVMYSASLGVAGATSPAGIALLLVTAVLWGLYGVTEMFLAPYPVRVGFGAISGYTAAGLLVMFFWKGDAGALSTIGGARLGLLILSALFGIAASHVLLYKAIYVLGAITSSGGLLLAPFVTWLGAATVLGEELSALQVAGGITLLWGTILLVRSRYLLDRALS